MTSSQPLLGYCDKISATAGEQIAFKVSGQDGQAFEVEIVRVICADPDPLGPGERYEQVATPFDAPLTAQHQPIHAGSSAVVENLPLTEFSSFSIAVWLWPTTPEKGRQHLLGQWNEDNKTGYALQITEDGSVCLRLGDNRSQIELKCSRKLAKRRWSCISASYNHQKGECSIAQTPQRQHPPLVQSSIASVSCRLEGSLSAKFTLAGGGFNGKLERPRLFTKALPQDRLEAAAGSHEYDKHALASWDFSLGIDSQRLSDIGPNGFHAMTRNTPARAVTGVDWDSSTLDFNQAPTQYAAVHFHSDDITDCRWRTSFEIKIGKDWRSGYYAARLIAADQIAFIPFFVCAHAKANKNRIAVIASSATYLAYANTHVKFDSHNSENLFESLLTVSDTELYLHEHRELGYSTYDTHEDDSGVFYSSWLRPILTMQPGHYTFNYVNDTHLLAWLEHEGFAYDVLTDHDLHQGGLEAIQGYDVIITPSHPEYTSKTMWDAIDTFQQQGGHHLYLGGNGFYWRIAFLRDRPEIMEIRRGGTGVRHLGG